jgi:ketosteroid isomerase-like protein
MKILILVIALSALASLGFAQKAHETSALQSMVDTERAFAAMSEKLGIRPAFMLFIADDGILFRPKAVLGKKWMVEHPVPPLNKRPQLKWQPGFADIARASDMGYTTGPWEFKDDMHDARPSAFGNFLTVWKKQANGSWKFAIDLGISNPEPTQPSAVFELPKNYKKPSKGPVVNIESERAALLALEREFSGSSAARGGQAAFLEQAAPDVRVFREGKLPFIGKEAASTAIPAVAAIWTWQPEAADVSSSGDLGYSYGLYRLENKDAGGKAESGNYLRIWKRHGGTWKIVVDLANPLPAG